jgi:hypothetical protein
MSGMQQLDDVERFAIYLADSFGCSHLADLPPAASEWQMHPVPRDGASRGERMRVEALPTGSAAPLSQSILVCRPPSAESCRALLPALASGLDHAPAALLVVRPCAAMPQPASLRNLLLQNGLDPAFVGWTPGNNPEKQLIAVLESNRRPRTREERGRCRVVAFMAAYNEGDIIGQSLRYLIGQGIGVYVLDNWSTDSTFEQVSPFVGGGVVGLERFPPGGPDPTYEWRKILARVETLAGQIDADWFMLHDVDERRYAPWSNLTLRDAVRRVDACGFNCIDHVVVQHWPTREEFEPDLPLEMQLPYYTFTDHAGHFHQRRAWKNPGVGVSLAPSAGHDVRFPGRLVYPFKFLLRHYPIRSQAHGERKVFADRARRWNQEERSLGWHQQYDHLTRGASLLRDPAAMQRVCGAEFEEQFLIERLSGIGVFDEAPSWATAPRQSFDW